MSADVSSNFPLMVPNATSAAGTLQVLAPFDRSIIGEVAAADANAVETALTNAYALYRNRDLWLPKQKRIEILSRMVAIMRERAETLAVESSREGGKPLIDSRIEIGRAIDSINICIETLRTEGGSAIPMGINAASAHHLAFTSHEPIGVVVAVSAFNHPLNLIAHQVGPAIASGCPVIVKPAEDTPLSCFRLVSILREAGLPEEWCQPLVVTDLAVAEQLVSDSRVGFFSFIGSAKVGWMLRSKLAPGARCALEHGGVAPVVVAADADLDDAIPMLAKAGFYHAGQVCVSVQRVFAESAVATELAERIAEAGIAMEVGDPTKESTDIGPIIRPSELDRIEQWVEEAVSAGAELLSGGKRISDTLFPPTVLLNPPEEAKVSTSEVFGPVICIYSYEDIDDAIERANALPVSFQAAAFTRSMDTALRCYSRLNGSAIMINDHTAFRVDWMPFAGLRTSGHGVGGVPHTMHEMQIEKMIVIRSREILD